jgi:hypothetical protein
MSSVSLSCVKASVALFFLFFLILLTNTLLSTEKEEISRTELCSRGTRAAGAVAVVGICDSFLRNHLIELAAISSRLRLPSGDSRAAQSIGILASW